MSDTLIILAGLLGMFIAIIHGYLGAAKVVQPVTGIPQSSKRILHAIFFLSAVYWFLGGALLIYAPYYMPSNIRHYVAIAVATLFLSGALGNFWAMRGRHFGWILLAIAASLAWYGR